MSTPIELRARITKMTILETRSGFNDTVHRFLDTYVDGVKTFHVHQNLGDRHADPSHPSTAWTEQLNIKILPTQQLGFSYLIVNAHDERVAENLYDTFNTRIQSSGQIQSFLTTGGRSSGASPASGSPGAVLSDKDKEAIKKAALEALLDAVKSLVRDFLSAVSRTVRGLFRNNDGPVAAYSYSKTGAEWEAEMTAHGGTFLDEQAFMNYAGEGNKYKIEFLVQYQ